MKAARKNVITRLVNTLAKEQEERRCLEEMTNAVREDVQGKVSQATQRVYQLRGRAIIITTPEASRRKKAARTDAVAHKSAPEGPAGAEERRQDEDTAGPSVPVPTREPVEQPQPQPVQAADEQAPPVDAGEAEETEAHAGQKRSRQAASPAKSKRAKAAQAARAERPQPAAAAGARRSSQKVIQAAQPAPVEPAAAPDGGQSPQPSKGNLAAPDQPVGTDMCAAAAPAQRPPDAEEPVARPQGSIVENAPRRTRDRQAKQAPKQPPENVYTDAEAGPSGTAAATASGAPAAPSFSTRVTRARRGQPAAAPAPASPPPDARQTRGRSTRQKRDVKEAQLGSPGLHPKTRTATDNSATPAPNGASAAAASPANNAEPAAAGGCSSAHGPDGGAPHPVTTVDQLGSRPSMQEQAARPGQPGATEEPGADPTAHDGNDGAVTDQPGEQPGAEPSACRPDGAPQQSAAATTEHPGAGAGPSVLKQYDAQQLEHQSASPGPDTRACVSQPEPEKLPTVSASNVRRMPAGIAATVAMFDSKAAAAGAGPGASGKARKVAGSPPPPPGPPPPPPAAAAGPSAASRTRRAAAPPPPPGPPPPPPAAAEVGSSASGSIHRAATPPPPLPAAAEVGPKASGGARRAAGPPPPPPGPPPPPPAFAAARSLPPVAAREPARGNPPPGPASRSEPTEADRGGADNLFSFGTKAKDQSSPSMPRFGPPDERATAERDDTVQPPSTATASHGTAEEPQTEGAPHATATEDAVAAVLAVDSGPSAAAEQAAEPEPLSEAMAGGAGEGADATDAGLASGAGEQLEGPRAEDGARAEARNRSLSLSLALRSPSFAAPGPATVFKQASADDEGSERRTPEPCGIGSVETASSGASQQRSLQEPAATTAGDGAEAATEEVTGDLTGPGPVDRELSLGGTADRRAEDRLEDATAEATEAQPECGTVAEAFGDNAEDQEGHDGDAGSDADADTSIPPAAEAAEEAPAGEPVEAQAMLNGCETEAVESTQPSKPKGGNLVSAVRSFLPQRAAPSPAPAAGKKVVKVKALEAAQAAKQKEAARAAERAARAAAADRQRQGQGDAGPSNAGTRPGVQITGAQRLTPTKAVPGTQAPSSARLTPTKVAPVAGSTRLTPTKAGPGAQVAASARRTPTKAAAQQGADADVTCPTTAGVVPLACQGAASTAVPHEKRTDCTASNAAAAMSVKAKAAFFQLKEEQAKRAAAEHGAGRKATGGAAAAAAPTIAQSGVPSYKAGAQARVALAAGDNEAALVASAAPAASTVSVSALNASRAAIPTPAAATAETVADKHKRVEAKRREEEERRRAELEARTKAKDDKLRNFEAAKQQQRLGGGAAAAGALRPPAPPAGNSVAAPAAGKRPPGNAAGGGAGQLGSAPIKPEPENHKAGPIGPAPAKTPAPKLATARTPGPKAGPVAGNMVSPAVQLQVKLLPAVHAQGAAGGAPGLPKPRPPGGTQAKQAPAAAAVGASQPAVKAEGVTPSAAPGVADLTEEERRHVHAIQTSPYIAQVKPRTPGVQTATKPVFNYEISPYRSDSDDDEDESGRSRKPVPAWAAHDKVLNAVRAQSVLDSDRIFGTYPSTIDIVKVFSDMPSPGDTDARGRPRRDYRRRGSSGIWDADL